MSREAAEPASSEYEKLRAKGTVSSSSLRAIASKAWIG
jgi:hypothetical protein